MLVRKDNRLAKRKRVNKGQVNEWTSRRVDKVLVRKDNRLAKRKRVNKLKTRSLVSSLVNLSTKICSSVTLSFIYSVYKQLVNSSTR